MPSAACGPATALTLYRGARNGALLYVALRLLGLNWRGLLVIVAGMWLMAMSLIGWMAFASGAARPWAS